MVRYAETCEKRWSRFERQVGGSWRVDETFIKVRGQWMYLYRAVDGQGNTVEFFLSRTRGIAAAKAFFPKALKHHREPHSITLDGRPARVRRCLGHGHFVSIGDRPGLYADGDRGSGARAPPGRRGVWAARISLGGIDPLLEEVKRHVPRWRTIDLALPIAGPVVSSAIDRSFGQPQSRAPLVMDRHSSAVVRFDTFADQNPGQRTRSWLRFVHTGEYYGVIGQATAGLASLAGVFLVYTGFSLGLRRSLAWKQRRAQSP